MLWSRAVGCGVTYASLLHCFLTSRKAAAASAAEEKRRYDAEVCVCVFRRTGNWTSSLQGLGGVRGSLPCRWSDLLDAVVGVFVCESSLQVSRLKRRLVRADRLAQTAAQDKAQLEARFLQCVRDLEGGHVHTGESLFEFAG